MKNTKPSSRERVVNAAMACFAKYGIAKTTMDDVAEAAQLARMTVYRAFPNRNALLHAVAMQTLEHFIQELSQEFKPGATFEEDFIAAVLRSVELARTDPLFVPLVQDTVGEGGLGFFVSEYSPIDDLLQRLWAPSLERARATQQLRPDLQDQELLTWFRDVVYLVLMRSDLDRPGQVAFLQKFMVPSLRCSQGTA